MKQHSLMVILSNAFALAQIFQCQAYIFADAVLNCQTQSAVLYVRIQNRFCVMSDRNEHDTRGTPVFAHLAPVTTVTLPTPKIE